MYRKVVDGPVVRVPGWGKARCRIVAENDRNAVVEFMTGPNAGRTVRVKRDRVEVVWQAA